MAPFLYRYPNTGHQVQGFVGDDRGASSPLAPLSSSQSEVAADLHRRISINRTQVLMTLTTIAANTPGAIQ
jgi:hypothetical protein